MPFNEALFWFGLTAFGAGIYFLFLLEPAVRRLYSIGMTIIGALACAYSVYRYHHPESELPAIHLWVILLILTWSLLGYSIYLGKFRRKPKEPSKLVINSANYAAWSGLGKRYDVTKYLRSIVTGHSLVFDRIENHSFWVNGQNLVPEDPLAGQPKKLEVTYSYDGELPKTIRRTEGDRLTLPEDSAMAWLGRELNKAKAAQLPLSPLQVEAIQLSSGLLNFLRQISPAPTPKYTRVEINNMTSADTKVLINAQDGDFFDACEYHFGDKHYFGQKTSQGLESELNARGTRMFTWYRKLEAAYALELKGKVEALRNRLVVEGIEADALIAPIPYKGGEQHIRSVAAKLWELAFKVGEKGNA